MVFLDFQPLQSLSWGFLKGVGGSYKLCYQAPGGSDSVEQNPETGAIGLKVLQVTTTGTERIESLSPTAVTSNVPTTISFVGAERGDKAKFVNAGSSSCRWEISRGDAGIWAGKGRFSSFLHRFSSIFSGHFGAFRGVSMDLRRAGDAAGQGRGPGACFFRALGCGELRAVLHGLRGGGFGSTEGHRSDREGGGSGSEHAWAP